MCEERLSPADLAALSIFPLPDATLFPGALLPLHVFEPRYRALVADALAGSHAFAVARLKPGFESDYGGRPPVFDVCGAGRIVEHTVLPDGRYNVMLLGVARVRLVRELPAATAYRVVRAELIDDLPADPRLCAGLEQEVVSLWRTLGPHLPAAVRDLSEVTRGAAGAGPFADRIAALLAGDPDASQALLAEPDPCERLRLVLEQLRAAVVALGIRAPVGKLTLN
jgi:Lon protease-like protein